MNSILRSIISCRTPDQLKACRGWLERLALAKRLTTAQKLGLDVVIEALLAEIEVDDLFDDELAAKSGAQEVPVFEWQKKTAQEMAQV